MTEKGCFYRPRCMREVYEYATLNDTKQDWQIHRETNITGNGTKLKIIFID